MGLWFRLQFGVALALEVGKAIFRRLLRHGVPGWSLPQEATIGALRRNGLALTRATPAEARLRSDALALPVPRGVTVERMQPGDVPARLFVPSGADPQDVLLYVHGGVYVCGSVRGYQELLGRLARLSGRAIVAFDYRLAPEAPFPAALEDTLAVHRALLGRHRVVAIAGDSAGGALAAAALVALRDAAAPLAALWSAAVALGGPLIRLRVHRAPCSVGLGRSRVSPALGAAVSRRCRSAGSARVAGAGGSSRPAAPLGARRLTRAVAR